MPIRDRLLASLVAVTWGLNFIAIHLSLEHFPPFFLVGLRFALLAIPTLIFVPRPGVPVRWLLGYGFGFGVLQFAFLYLGMVSGMPTGLASLVLQASAPFTVVLAAVFLRERLTVRQVVGISVAIGGLSLVAVHRSHVSALLPVVLTLLAALGWAFGNLCSRQAQPQSPLRLTLWMSVVPPLPMFALALVIEGPRDIWHSVATMATAEAVPAVAGLAYTIVIGTVVGSGIWTTLMKRHPSSQVAPFSMLVPVVGLAASWLILGERTPALELVGGAVVVAGVLYASLTPKRRDRRRAGSPPAATESAVPVA